ncbi:MAG: fluoride efflux transporter CrcB [Saprospiraceae bacterium]|nr:fluoride efflux transporter CrcB [Saprospiraceae bacterium]
MEWLAVFLGGGLGSLARFGIAKVLQQRHWDFAWATLLANVISCVILGILITNLTKSAPAVRIFWIVGFCGGFSTFSTFTAETFQFFQSGNYLYGAVNIIASLVVCLIGLFIGLRIATDLI